MADTSSLVGVDNKRQRSRAQSEALAAHLREDRGVSGGQRRRQISHRHRRVEAWAETAGSDVADRLRRGFVGVEACTFAHRRTAFRLEADAAARRAVLELRKDDIGTRKPAGPRAALAAALLYRPFQRGLDRGRRRIEVMPIKTKSGFQS